jgi:hypothetical protein
MPRTGVIDEGEDLVKRRFAGALIGLAGLAAAPVLGEPVR